MTAVHCVHCVQYLGVTTEDSLTDKVCEVEGVADQRAPTEQVSQAQPPVKYVSDKTQSPVKYVSSKAAGQLCNKLSLSCYP